MNEAAEPPASAPPGATAQALEYDAFISYRRRDGYAVAAWLRDRLRRTELPLEVLGQLGGQARQLHVRRPRIFLDTAFEKPSADFLGEKIYPALDRARRLIVVSTPAAFERGFDRYGRERPNWLEEEIRHFLAGSDPRSPARPIEVVLGPGAPADRYPGLLDDNHSWDWIDLRGYTRLRALGLTDALDGAVAKLLAAVYDVPEHLLPLVLREEQRRRNRLLLYIGAIVTVLLAITTLLAVLAVAGQVRANRATADARAGLASAQVELANAQALAAAARRAGGDNGAAARLLVEARTIAPTPLVTAQLFASERPRVTFRRTLVRAGSQGAWAMAFLADGGALAIGRFDGSVATIDTVAGGTERILVAPGGPPVTDIAVAGRKSRLFVLRRAPADAAWNDGPGASDILGVPLGPAAQKHFALTPRPGEPGFLSLAVDPEGRWLLVGTDRDVRLFDLTRDTASPTILPGDGGAPFKAAAVTLSSNGRYAAAASTRGEVRLWDLQDRSRLRSHQVPRPVDYYAYTTLAPTFDPSGHVLAFGSFDGTVHLWRVAEEKAPERNIQLHRSAIAALAWNLDGTILASGAYDGSVAIFELASGREVGRLPAGTAGSVAGVVRLAFAPDGRMLAASDAVAVSKDDLPGKWLFGAVRTWSIDRTVTQQTVPLGFDFASDGRLALWHQDGDTLMLGGEFAQRRLACATGFAWTPLAEGQRTGRPVQVLQAAGSGEGNFGGVVTSRAGPPGEPLLGGVALAPDGLSLALLTGQIDSAGEFITLPRLLICDTRNGLLQREVAIPMSGVTSLVPVVFDRDGKKVIFAVVVRSGEKGGTYVFGTGIAEGAATLLGYWPGRVLSSMALAPHGSAAALADDSGELAMLDLTEGHFTELPQYLAGQTQQVSFDPTGRYLYVAGLGQLRAIDLTLQGGQWNERRASVPVGMQATAVTVTPDSAVLVVGEASGDVSFWNSSSLVELARVRAHSGPVLALGASPDGNALISIGADRLRIAGRHLALTRNFAARLTRLAVVGGTVQPLDEARETVLVHDWPDAGWPTEADADAAEFWRLVRAGGIRRVRPISWWDWLWWSGPFELDAALTRWRNQHAGHPLSAALEIIAYGALASVSTSDR